LTMNYKVKLTKQATQQLQNTIEYISKILQEPEAAKRWSERIKKGILSLDQMPLRFPLVEEKPWRTEGIHKMAVENFTVYYWVNEPSATVWVIAVIYSRRDQIAALYDMPRE